MTTTQRRDPHKHTTERTHPHDVDYHHRHQRLGHHQRQLRTALVPPGSRHRRRRILHIPPLREHAVAHTSMADRRDRHRRRLPHRAPPKPRQLPSPPSPSTTSLHNFVDREARMRRVSLRELLRPRLGVRLAAASDALVW